MNYWSHFGAIEDFRGLQVIDFVVPGARIELATPAFSGLASPDAILLIHLSLLLIGPPFLPLELERFGT